MAIRGVLYTYKLKNKLNIQYMFYESILLTVYVHILFLKIPYSKTICTLKTPINRSKNLNLLTSKILVKSETKIDMVLKYKLSLLIYAL